MKDNTRTKTQEEIVLEKLDEIKKHGYGILTVQVQSGAVVFIEATKKVKL